MDPHVSKYLEGLRGSPPPSGDPVVGMRAHFEAMNDLFPSSEVHSVDRHVELDGRTLKIRLYNANTATGPAILYFHGGGFIGGSLHSHDNFCRYLAKSAETMVVAVDYRRAPECGHPAALDDAVDTAEWVLRNADELKIDPSKLAVMGDSSGGYLAAQVALRNPGLALQILLYPALDLTRSGNSHREFAFGFGLDAPMIDFCYQTYAGPACTDPALSPAVAALPDRVPPAVIVVGSQDPLLDDAKAYAERIMSAGGMAYVTIVPDQVHGFLGMPAILPGNERYLDQVVARYKAAVA